MKAHVQLDVLFTDNDAATYTAQATVDPDEGVNPDAIRGLLLKLLMDDVVGFDRPEGDSVVLRMQNVYTVTVGKDVEWVPENETDTQLLRERNLT